MKINMFSLWQSFRTACNTYQGGFYRPQIDFEQKVNDISMELFVEKTNMSDKSFEIKDDLQYLLKSINKIVKAAKGNYGTFDFPDSYGRFASARILVAGSKTVPSMDENVAIGDCQSLKDQEEITEEYYASIVEHPVQLIDNQRWAGCLEHPTKGPTLSKPKMTQSNGQYKVAPRGVSVIVMDYYVEPERAVFGYTLAPGDRQTGGGAQIIYDQGKSKDLPWPNTMRNEFIARLGEAFGIFTRDQFLTAANAKKTA
jgi:hypothetical protein